MYWYAGAPTAGKTTKALSDLGHDIRRTGKPALIIDSQGVWNFKNIPHAQSVREAILAVWKHHQHIAFTPESIDQVDQLAAAVRAGGDCHVLVDEARYWMSAHAITPALSRLMRIWQHSRISIRLTTQRLEDIHQDALACTTQMYVFRCTSPRTLDRLEREYAFSREEVAQLPRGEYLVWTGGF